MNALKQTILGPTNEEISREAYYLWERDGRPIGRDMEFWLQAEVKLRKARSTRQKQEAWIAPTSRATTVQGTRVTTLKVGNGAAPKKAGPAKTAKPSVKKSPRTIPSARKASR